MARLIKYALIALKSSITSAAPNGTEFFRLDGTGTPETTQKPNRAMRWKHREDAQAYVDALNPLRWTVVEIEFDGDAKVGA